MSLYSELLKPVLFRLDAERAHHLALAGLRVGGHAPSILAAVFGGSAPRAERRVCGVRPQIPLASPPEWTKTPSRSPRGRHSDSASSKSAPSRLTPSRATRHPASSATPTSPRSSTDLDSTTTGPPPIASRLHRLRDSGRWPTVPVGVNIGKTKVTDLSDAPADYRQSFEKLRSFGDYFVVNVSSPNTPGLRDLQHVDALRAIMDTLRAVDATKPIFVKIAPDLAETDLDPLVEIPGISGFVATNTSLDHSALPPDRDETGGLSGAPITSRSHSIFVALRSRTTLPVIASGGIMTADDAHARFDAGAELVQIYTGFVYNGPDLIREICESA